MAKKKESYEEKIEKLDAIVKDMENGQLPLQSALEKYEEGIKLYREALGILQEAEGKIKLLTDDGEVEFVKEEE